MEVHRLGIAICAISFVAACGDGTGPSSAISSPTDIESAVTALGFRTEGIIERGDFIIVEGDIALPKARLLRAAASVKRTVDSGRGMTPQRPSLQWVTDARVNATTISNVVVDLTGIASDAAWLAATRSAMANWNAVPGTTIYFSEGSPANTYVAFKNLGRTDAIAQAHFPVGATGQPGDSIFINTIGPSLTASQQVYNMTHEFGHTVGFRHSNWQGYQCNGPRYETQYPEGANLVTGTPQADASSVMNACSGDRSWAGFSHYDQVAASQIYNNLSATEANVGGYSVVTVTYPRGAISVVLEIEYAHTEWYDHLQQFQTNYFYQVVDSPPSGGQSAPQIPWGSQYCSDWHNHPWPQDEAAYRLRVEYPQRSTITLTGQGAAHVLGPSVGDYQCS